MSVSELRNDGEREKSLRQQCRTRPGHKDTIPPVICKNKTNRNISLPKQKKSPLQAKEVKRKEKNAI